MVRPRGTEEDGFKSYTRSTRALAKGCLKNGKPAVWVVFTPELFAKITAEAKDRGVSFSAQVRHLCEASIDGIE